MVYAVVRCGCWTMKAGGTVVAQVDVAAGAGVDPEHDPDRLAIL